MASVNDIKVTLTLDGSNMTMTAKRAGEVLKQLTGDMQRTANNTDKLQAHFGSLFTRFKDLVVVGGMLRFVMYDIRDIFDLTIGKVLEASGEIERMTKLMEGLSKETTKQAQAMEALRNRDFVFDLAKTAPFEITAITDSFIKLKTAGIDPTNGSLQALLDGIARFGGGSEQLKRASVAIQQMAGKGVISMEELRQQLGEAVPNAMQLMSQATGMGMREMVKEISLGRVQSGKALTNFFIALDLETRGSAENMMTTWKGMLERLKTEFALALKKIGDQGMFDGAKKALKELLDGFNSESMVTAAREIGQALATMVRGLTSFVNFIRENSEAIGTFIKAATYAILGLVAVNTMKKAVDILGEFRDKFIAAQVAMDLQRAKSASAQRALDLKTRTEQDRAFAEQRLKEATAAENKLRFEFQKSNAELQTAIKSRMAAKEETLARELEDKKQLASRLSTLAIIDAQIMGSSKKQIAAMRAAARQEQLELEADYAKRSAMSKAYWEGRLRDQTVALAREHAANAAAARQNVEFYGTMTAAARRSADEAARTADRVTRGVATGMGVVATATNGARLAFSMLGGWMTVAFVAVEAGMYLWNGYRNSAQQAAIAVRENIKTMTASKEDVKTLNQALADGKKRLDDLKAAATSLQTGVPAASWQSWFAAISTNAVRALPAIGSVADGLRKIAQLKLQVMQGDQAKENAANSAALKKAREDVYKTELADWQTSENKKVEDFTKASGDALARESQAQRALLTQKHSNIKDAQARTKAIEDDHRAWVREQGKKSAEQELKFVEERYKKQEENLKQELALGAKANQNKVKAYQGLLADLGRSMDTLRERANAMPTYGSYDDTRGAAAAAGGGGAAKDKQGDFLLRLQGDVREYGVRYKDIQLQASDVAKYRDQAFEQVRQALDEGRLDLVMGSGKSKKTSRPGEVPEGIVQLQATLLAYKNVPQELERAATAMASLRERMASNGEGLREDLEKSQRAMATGFEFDTKFDTIDRFFAKLGAKLDANAAQWVAWGNERRRQLADASVFDASQYTLAATTEANAINRNLMTERAAREANYNHAVQVETKKYEMLIANLDAIEEKTAEHLLLKAQLEAAHGQKMQALHAQYLRQSETPMARMSREWKDTTKQMQDAAVGWANRATDAMVNFVKTGKLEFKDLVDSILTDILRIRMQKMMSEGINGLIDSFASKIGGMMDGSKVFGGGGDGGILSTLGNMFKFADGGIMTGGGAVELRKYAMGGVANTPQLAMFGEGSQPEAYVPLPDGRTIPVTMQGGQQAAEPSNVIVNVINQTSMPVNAQKSEPRFDGKQMILDVVLSAASQPGSFREGMKGALA